MLNAAVRSPDGVKVATTIVDIASASDKRELWISDLERGTKSLFWFKSPVMGPAIWSPDGTRLLFPIVDNGPQLYERPIDGLQDGRVVFKGDRGEPISASDWSADGRFVLMNRVGQQTASDIWAVTVADGTATPLIQGPTAERDGRLSRDGRWIAYTATGNGGQEVYVTGVVSSSPALAVGGGPWRVSSGGGNLPRWRADGRELLFARPSTNDARREPVNVIVNWTPDPSR